jgi:hypothetical protein
VIVIISCHFFSASFRSSVLPTSRKIEKWQLEIEKQRLAAKRRARKHTKLYLNSYVFHPH